MFDRIAGSYDLLNHLLSFGIDRKWRKMALKTLDSLKGTQTEFLDLATGTCDLAIQAASMYPEAVIQAADISEQMLEIGRQKIKSRNLEKQIQVSLQDAEHLNFIEGRFDAITIAFGIRNFENLNKGIAEMYRVLKPSGKMVILEFSQTRSFPVKQIFHFYFKYLLPCIGNLISKDGKAYRYLYESVQHFPDYERLTAILQQEGFRECSFKPLTFGICTIYTGTK
jgi:demethylmenaquinone methyltransferase/2-methoxy-6-polyprenyl-1,4-benzoquinol methylase